MTGSVRGHVIQNPFGGGGSGRNMPGSGPDAAGRPNAADAAGSDAAAALVGEPERRWCSARDDAAVGDGGSA